jgi:hypothetical protein
MSTAPPPFPRALTAAPDGRPVLDLRAAGAARRPDLAALPPLSDNARQVAIDTWRGRMANEHASARVWAGLLPQAMAAALPPALLAGIAAAASDELRHAEQCAGVVLALGGVPVCALPDMSPIPAHAELGPLEAFLRNILSVGCLSETVAVSLIRAEQAELEGGPLSDVLEQILADEVAHARLGWTAVGLIAPRLSPAQRAALEPWLEHALRHLVAHELPLLPLRQSPLDPAATAAGVCDGGDARRLFGATVSEVIVPRLEAAGLPAAAAWARAAA